MFTQQDLQQIAGHGLTLGQVETQLENFRRGFPFLNVVRAASPGDGVTVVDRAQADEAAARYEAAAGRLGIVKFVPASGAATPSAARASTPCWKISRNSPSGPS